MEIDAGLLWTAMSHQGGNDGKIDAAIHQMRSEAMSQRSGCDVGGQISSCCSGADNRAYVLYAQSPFTNVRPEQWAAFSALQQIGKQFREDGLWNRNRARPFALRCQDQEFVALTIYMRHVKRAQFVRA
jgi:hypothetical protein